MAQTICLESNSYDPERRDGFAGTTVASDQWELIESWLLGRVNHSHPWALGVSGWPTDGEVYNAAGGDC
jgi:hypothetical protein